MTSWAGNAFRLAVGSFVGTICGEIRQREMFMADVTSLNPNVLFELGFAVSTAGLRYIIAGLAYGLGKDLLMLAHEPYVLPYRLP